MNSRRIFEVDEVRVRIWWRSQAQHSPDDDQTNPSATDLTSFHQPPAIRFRRRFGPIAHLQFGEDVADVRFDGA